MSLVTPGSIPGANTGAAPQSSRYARRGRGPRPSGPAGVSGSNQFWQEPGAVARNPLSGAVATGASTLYSRDPYAPRTAAVFRGAPGPQPAKTPGPLFPGQPPGAAPAPAPRYTAPGYQQYQQPEIPNRLPTRGEVVAGGYAPGARKTEILAPELARYIPSERGGKFGKSDLNTVSAEINLENIARARMDREAAYGEYSRALEGLGMSPESQLARQVATERLQNPDIFNPQEMSLQEEMIRGRAGRGYEGALRSAQENAAARGIGGLSSYEQAQLGQESERQASDELQNLAIQAALQREEKQRGALGTLGTMASDEETRRLAIQEALARLYADTEYGQVDLSGLSRSKK